MKALVYTGTQEVVYRDEPEPDTAQSQDNQVLVKVEACGLCGSDMHAYHGLDARRVPPLILGHEVTGVVQSGHRQGEQVIINPLISCGSCDLCMGGRPHLCAERELLGMRMAGAFADFVAVPQSSMLSVPADMEAAHASLTEPTAVSLHSIAVAERALHRPVSEARVAVIGAGAIGVLAALLLQGKGALMSISVIPVSYDEPPQRSMDSGMSIIRLKMNRLLAHLIWLLMRWVVVRHVRLQVD